MDNTYNVHNEEENNSLNININYVRPIFHRRVLANMIDFFIFAFLWLISFTIAGNIAKSTNSYKEKQNYINTIHLNSDLYKIDNTGKIYSVISYYNHYQLNTTTQEKINYVNILIILLFSFPMNMVKKAKKKFKKCMMIFVLMII